MQQQRRRLIAKPLSSSQPFMSAVFPFHRAKKSNPPLAVRRRVAKKKALALHDEQPMLEPPFALCLLKT